MNRTEVEAQSVAELQNAVEASEMLCNALKRCKMPNSVSILLELANRANEKAKQARVNLYRGSGYKGVRMD